MSSSDPCPVAYDHDPENPESPGCSVCGWTSEPGRCSQAEQHHLMRVCGSCGYVARAVPPSSSNGAPVTSLDPGLPWYRVPWRRCRAVREKQGVDEWFGRCELEPHGPELDHALDRALDYPRWSTRWTQ